MIHLIVGNTGSGKTTYSKLLKEETKGVIFSIDMWNKVLFLPDKKEHDGLAWMLDRIDRAESMIFNLIEQLENAHVDSILDLGFSKLVHRKKFRTFADTYNFERKLHFLDIPKEIRYNRIQKRNIEKGDTFEFEVSKTDFDFMETWFEKPGDIEMTNGIIIKK